MSIDIRDHGGTFGGGSSKINGIIKSYLVQAGETISAGDFVDFIQEKVKSHKNTYDISDQSSIYHENTLNSSMWVDACVLDDKRLFIMYSYTADHYGYGVIIKVDGHTFTIGNVVTISTSQTWTTSYISVCKVDTDKIFVAFSYNGSQGSMMTLSASGTTLTALSGRTGFYNNETHYIDCLPIDNSRILLAYTDSANAYGYLQMVTYNWSTNTFTIGAQFGFETTRGSNSYLSLSLLDTNTVALGYYNAWYGRPFITILSISGTTISTKIAPVQVSNTDQCVSLRIISLNSTHILFVTQDYTTTGYGVAYVITVGSSSLTIGTKYTFDANSRSFESPTRLIRLDSETVVAGYLKGNYLRLVFFVIKNNQIVDSKVQVALDSVPITFPSIVNLSEQHLVSTFADNNGYLSSISTFISDSKFGVAKTSGTGGQYIDVLR